MDALIENIFNLSGLNLIIWAMYIGILLATALAYYQKRIVGGFVRTVLSKGARTPDTAMTLTELGYQNHPFIRRELSKSGPLRKMIWEVEDNYRMGENDVLYSAREKALDLNIGRFYLPEEKRIEAELRYEGKGSDVFTLIMTVAVFFVVAVLACIWLPVILESIHLYEF